MALDVGPPHCFRSPGAEEDRKTKEKLSVYLLYALEFAAFHIRAETGNENHYQHIEQDIRRQMPPHRDMSVCMGSAASFNFDDASMNMMMYPTLLGLDCVKWLSRGMTINAALGIRDQDAFANQIWTIRHPYFNDLPIVYLTFFLLEPDDSVALDQEAAYADLDVEVISGATGMIMSQTDKVMEIVFRREPDEPFTMRVSPHMYALFLFYGYGPYGVPMRPPFINQPTLNSQFDEELPASPADVDADLAGLPTNYESCFKYLRIFAHIRYGRLFITRDYCA